MGGDGAANAGSSGHEREGERGRSDARVEPVSGSVDDAERPEADVPPGLWQFARKQLREAYFHAARASVRDLELNPRPARDDDRLAADPPDPEPGVRRVLSAIRDLATAARDEVDEVDEDDEDDEVDAAEDARAQKRVKRRRKKATRVSSVRARFDADDKAAARRARADWRAARALLLDDGGGECAREHFASPAAAEDAAAFWRRAVAAHLERAAESERRARWRTETITKRHGDLRRRAGGSKSRVVEQARRDRETSADAAADAGDRLEDLAASETAWRAATGVSADAEDAASALAYAEAAEETGRRPWVTEALRWCHDFATRFLRGGGAAAFALKAERRRFFSETGTRMTDAEAEARLRALTRGRFGMEGDPGLVPRRDGRERGDGSGNPTAGARARDARKRPNAQLLDVGSCWDYFRAFEDAATTYEVVALDLEPRSSCVFRCDFLELAIVDEAREMETSALPSVPSDDAEHRETRGQKKGSADVATLRSYPANRASAVVMSLVLSYLPDPRMRGEMVRRARRVLLDDGRGVLLVVTPHSTDRSYSRASKTDALAVWKEAIESLGFERVAYARKSATHCFAFRTVGVGPGAVEPGEAPALPIAFDAKERETTRERRSY